MQEVYEIFFDFRPISRFICYGMQIENRTHAKAVAAVPLSMTLIDHLTQILRSRHYLTLNVSETVQGTSIVTMEY